MKKPLIKIWLITLLTIQLFGNSLQIAHAETADSLCPKLNNLSGSIKAQGKEPAKADDVKLADKLLVITEEPLGTADNETTFICYRQVICSIEKVQDTSKKPATTKDKRVCKTSYVGSKCDAKSFDEISKIQSTPDSKEAYTTCERIMVYLSPAGTNLMYYYIGQIYRYMAFLGGIIAVLTIIIGGLLRATAGDNSEQVSKANSIITKCITGLVLLFLSAIILYVINPNFFIITQ
jgi:hypothetical protein